MKRALLILSGIVAAIFLISSVVAQTTLIATEYQVTTGPQQYYSPTLGHDAIGDYVVFTAYTPISGAPPQSDIYYQRLVNGQPVGPPVPVAVTALNERMNDCSGDYIVYTLFPSVSSSVGKIMLYQISTGQTRELNSDDYNFSPKIYGDVVVWLRMTSSGNTLLMYRISSGVPVQSVQIAGPIPNPKDLDVGDRFVVWSYLQNGQFGLGAYDLINNVSFVVADDPTNHERMPSTSGAWVVYQISGLTNPAVVALHARNLDTGEARIIADNGAYNGLPSIDGNLITYQSNVSGKWEIYVYRIDHGDTFQITSKPNDQALGNVRGNLVAYIDYLYEINYDVFVSNLSFNRLPIANAGTPQSVHANSVVILDGSGSSDPDGTPLTYEWSFLSRPPESTAAFSDFTALNPTFIPDKPGDYLVQLVVTDSFGGVSQPAQVTISTWNSAPVADAGPDQAIIQIGTLVNLDGTQSYDPDGDSIAYEWILTAPPGSNAILTGANTATPTFLVDAYGSYSVQLIVRDPWTQAGDSMLVSFDNIQPVANAGTSQSAQVGDTVTLNGSGSSDANGDPLTFSWAITSFPPGSVALIADKNAMITSFIPDMAGPYVIQLVVNDGRLTSNPSTIQVQVVASPTVPTEATKDVQETIGSLDPSVFKNTNLQKTFNNKLNAVIADIEAGNYAVAIDKLQNDILGKTDGCANVGAPDSNDWIKDCESQAQVYPLILQVIEILRGL